MKRRRMPKLSKLTKRWLALVPVVIAVVVIAVLMRTRSGSVMMPVTEIGTPLRVITVPMVDLVPRVYGHGLAEPTRVWQAVAQVKGSAVFVSPHLDAGLLVEQGTILVKIDPADYELAVTRLEAVIAETRARLAELDAEQRHHEDSVKIEKASLALVKTSLQRKRKAQKNGAISPDEVDREMRTVLQQQQTIQQLENALDLLPARRRTLEATLASHTADLEQAKLNLERTVIDAPFACRVANIAIEQGQFVSVGQTMFEAHGTEAVEIEATFRPEQLRTLLDDDKRHVLETGGLTEAWRNGFELKAMIWVRSGEWEATWPARFDRIREAVDPRTRAINVIAIVDDPYAKVLPGIRPVLVRGMYCEMELTAPVRPGSVVLPRSAIHGDQVYLMDAEGRLRKQTVRIAFTQGEIAIVEAGLVGGERLIVSDPTPAIEGMKVEALPDPDLRRNLIDQAQGKDQSE